LNEEGLNFNMRQNLGNDQPKKQKVPLPFSCEWCTKKYKTKEKYENHILDRHPFASKYKNTATFTLNEKLWLLDAIDGYSSVLINGGNDFVLATMNIEATPAIHATFRERIMPHLPALLSDGPQILRIIADFEAFLNLGIPWRGGNFCPSMLIDLVWHSAMQNREKYEMLCKRFMNGASPLSHCVAPEEESEERFKYFEKQFKHQHNRNYISIGDIVMGGGSGIQNARNVLIEEDYEKTAKLEAERRSWQAREQKRQQEILEMKRNGTWVEPPKYFDNGKC